MNISEHTGISESRTSGLPALAVRMSQLALASWLRPAMAGIPSMGRPSALFCHCCRGSAADPPTAPRRRLPCNGLSTSCRGG